MLHHDERAVPVAVEQALNAGAASKQHALNLPARLIELVAPTPIDTPPRLQLVDELVANVKRYSELRGVGQAS